MENWICKKNKDRAISLDSTLGPQSFGGFPVLWTQGEGLTAKILLWENNYLGLKFLRFFTFLPLPFVRTHRDFVFFPSGCNKLMENAWQELGLGHCWHLLFPLPVPRAPSS